MDDLRHTTMMHQLYLYVFASNCVSTFICNLKHFSCSKKSFRVVVPGTAPATRFCLFGLAEQQRPRDIYDDRRVVIGCDVIAAISQSDVCTRRLLLVGSGQCSALVHFYAGQWATYNQM